VAPVVRISELEDRDVVNITDGRRLGNVVDVEIDLESGRIVAVVIPGPQRLLGLLGRDNDLVIPWERIKKIGADVILVEVPAYAEPHFRTR
jgi:YlmC/YmxH family sporulation protein